MAEFEAHNLAEDGDVLVISGVSGMSNMGGISSFTGQRQGERGAIVMGGVRDVRHSRSIDYPVWASEITPVTGKWRLETVEINGEIQMGDVRVNPGDLVVADDTGVVLHPARRHHAGAGAVREKEESRGHPHRRDHRRASRCRCSTPRVDVRSVSAKSVAAQPVRRPDPSGASLTEATCEKPTRSGASGYSSVRSERNSRPARSFVESRRGCRH